MQGIARFLDHQWMMIFSGQRFELRGRRVLVLFRLHRVVSHQQNRKRNGNSWSKSLVDDSDPFTYKPSLGRLDSFLEKASSEYPPPLITDDVEGDDEYADDLYEFDDIQSPNIGTSSSVVSQSTTPGASSSSQSLIGDPPVRETSDGSSGSSQQQLPSWDQFHLATAEMFLNPTRLYSISHALSSRNLPDAVKDHGFITPEDVRAFIATSEVCLNFHIYMSRS